MSAAIEVAKFDPPLSLSELTTWRDIPADRETWVTTGYRVQQALLLALDAAEGLAAASGLVSGQYLIGDSMRLSWSRAPAHARDLYMGAHNLAAAIGETVVPDAANHADTLPLPPQSMGQVLIVALGVIGLAAIISTAWYAARTTTVRIHATQARQVARVVGATHVATALVRAGKPIPKSLLADLHIDQTKPVHPAWGWLAFGALGALAIGSAVGSSLRARG